LLGLLLLLSGCGGRDEFPHFVPDLSNRPYAVDHDAPVRGDVSKKQIALVFTGGDFGEGTQTVLDTLADRNIRASFFVTGGFLRDRSLRPQLRRAIADGHYLGPHSDAHLLYCPWDDRARSLVTEAEFKNDLRKNIDDLARLGAVAGKSQPIFFIPPFEWYNADHVRWAREMGVLLFNFTPGSGSNRDYAPEGHKSFVPTEKLMADVLAYEQKDPHGLNGFLLLLHLGSERTDKVPRRVGGLLDALQARGYSFVRIDEMLSP
jgi:peptidoglycan/xylan/chitin deacetylase (PgdA/CDA1 family)